MHLVSNVEGDAPEGVDPVDVLMAALPAGTLSGAPKVRAMQIIDELETEKRGVVYAGAVGYFGCDGSVDTCIVLRTGAGEGRHALRPGRRRRRRRQQPGRRVRRDAAEGRAPCTGRPRRPGASSKNIFPAQETERRGRRGRHSPTTVADGERRALISLKPAASGPVGAT